MERKLYRSRGNQMIAGVCGGLGEFLGVDPTLIRVLFALLALIGVGSGVLIYLIMMFVVPLEPEGHEGIGLQAEEQTPEPLDPPSQAPPDQPEA